MNNLLVVEDLRVTYGGVTAVDGVSLTAAEGEIVGLIGPNGAGKSSLIDALTGYHPAAGGQVTFAGLPLRGARPYAIARRGLIAPISEVDPTSYTLFVVPALGAALIGRFSSFGAMAAAGLALGVVQSEIVHLQTVFTWLPQQGLGDGVPFVLILVVMTLSAQRLRGRGVMGHWRNPSIGRPARPLVTAALTFVIGVVAMVLLHGSDRVALMAAAAAVPVGILIGLPPLRVRGVNLAVITLAATAAIDALVFNPSWFSGGLGGRTVPPPTIFGLNLGVASGNSYPRIVSGVFQLVIVTLIGLSVARMRLGDRADADRGALQRAGGRGGRHPGRPGQAVRFRAAAM